MPPRMKYALWALAVALLGACSPMASTSQNPMSFFVTSVNPGKAGDLGGLAGADAYCQQLASTVNAGGKNWRAYLSTTASATSPAINARDRIGRGPWQNAKGVVVAANLEELHGDNKLNKQTALTEKGEIISGVGDPVVMHDMLTGATPDGRVAIATGDTTCSNWTQSGAGSAIVGHSDRTGLSESAPAKSWNASHATRGCSLDLLKVTGSAGLFYCFAAN